MGKNSKIEWCHHTFNPWIGCTRVSPGCLNCYAEALMDQRMGRVRWGPGQPRSRTSEANWRKPLTWNRQADEALTEHELLWQDATPMERRHARTGPAWPERPRVFCASLADWLDHEVPARWLADLLALVHETHCLDWLLLTKRPGLWRQRLLAALPALATSAVGGRQGEGDGAYGMVYSWLEGEAPANVWLGTTAEDQQRADERIPELLKIPALVRFLSCEPLIGPLVLPDRFFCQDAAPWVICGGESGPGARPMHPAWARDLRDQCQGEEGDRRVAFFFKQWGAWAPREHLAAADALALHPDLVRHDGSGQHMARVGKKKAGRDLDGRTWSELPQ